MGNQRTLILKRNQKEDEAARKIEEAISSYKGIEFEVDISGTDIRKHVEHKKTDHYSLIVIPTTYEAPLTVSGEPSDISALKTRLDLLSNYNPNANFVFSTAPVQKRVITLEEAIQLGKYRIHEEVMNINDEGQIHKLLNKMREEGLFINPQNIAFFGNSKTSRALAGLIRVISPQFKRTIRYIDWYSAHSVESTDTPHADTSIEDVIEAKDLRNLIDEGILRIHTTIDSFANQVASGTDRLFGFAAPYKDEKDYASEKVRGEGSDEFYEDLFSKSIPAYVRLGLHLAKHGFKGTPDVISNPNGPCALVLGKTLGDEEKHYRSIISTTPDHVRAKQILARLLFQNREIKSKMGWENVNDINVIGAKVYGEHHNPLVDLETTSAGSYDGLIKSLKGIVGKNEISALEKQVEIGLAKLASRTMAGSTRARTDFHGAPAAILDSLIKEATYTDDDERTHAVWHPNIAEGVFMQGNPDELSEERRGIFYERAEEQREMYKRHEKKVEETIEGVKKTL